MGLETAEFQQWCDRPPHSDPNIFWLKGKPGAGKSTIMKTVVKHLEEREQEGIVLSFFFNARGQPLEQSVEGLYRTMLYQLFDRVPSLFVTTKAMQMYAHKPAWSTEMLRGLF
jgi:Cdc6-like AAA superfamily ATPase